MKKVSEKGDAVEGESSRGSVAGEAQETLIAPIDTRGHRTAASNANPQYRVRRDATGAGVAPEPGSPEKRGRS